jgi:hypothetical protein
MWRRYQSLTLASNFSRFCHDSLSSQLTNSVYKAVVPFPKPLASYCRSPHPSPPIRPCLAECETVRFHISAILLRSRLLRCEMDPSISSVSRHPTKNLDASSDLLWIDDAEPSETQAKSKRVHIANIQRKRRDALRQKTTAYSNRGVQTPNWVHMNSAGSASEFSSQGFQTFETITSLERPSFRRPVTDMSLNPWSNMAPVDDATIVPSTSAISGYDGIILRFPSGYHDLGLHLCEAVNFPDFKEYSNTNATALHKYALYCMLDP